MSAKSQPKPFPNPSPAFGWMQKNNYLDPDKTQLIRQYATGPVVLDIGAATGKYAGEIVRLGFTPISLEPNFGFLAQNNHGNLINGSAQALPLKAKSVDTAMLLDVLEHIPESALIEVKRVTKHRLLLTVPRTTDPELRNVFLLFGHHLDTTHLRTYSPASLSKTLLKAGFNLISITETHPISTDALFLNLFHAPMTLKKILRKVNFVLMKKKIFYSNLTAVADLG